MHLGKFNGCPTNETAWKAPVEEAVSNKIPSPKGHACTARIGTCTRKSAPLEAYTVKLLDSNTQKQRLPSAALSAELSAGAAVALLDSG
jgi:hypothetical protein